ncbi:hypothetical protein P9G49_03725, partial [Heyndrickxia coagulans]|uniref:hypothetical protein n=1 Tax=Heyndrickxia coagulans TaxID=1398 RepID=UPI002E02F0FE|nr:hypothetical protein [Heyndrickxia coagulans]
FLLLRADNLSNDGGSLSSDTGEFIFRKFDEKIVFSKTITQFLHYRWLKLTPHRNSLPLKNTENMDMRSSFIFVSHAFSMPEYYSYDAPCSLKPNFPGICFP